MLATRYSITYFARNFAKSSFSDGMKLNVLLILQETLQSHPFLMQQNFEKHDS